MVRGDGRERRFGRLLQLESILPIWPMICMSSRIRCMISILRPFVVVVYFSGEIGEMSPREL